MTLTGEAVGPLGAQLPHSEKYTLTLCIPTVPLGQSAQAGEQKGRETFVMSIIRLKVWRQEAVLVELELTEHLSKMKKKAGSLHGDMSQGVLAAFQCCQSSGQCSPTNSLNVHAEISFTPRCFCKMVFLLICVICKGLSIIAREDGGSLAMCLLPP